MKRKKMDLRGRKLKIQPEKIKLNITA